MDSKNQKINYLNNMDNKINQKIHNTLTENDNININNLKKFANCHFILSKKSCPLAKDIINTLSFYKYYNKKPDKYVDNWISFCINSINEDWCCNNNNNSNNAINDDNTITNIFERYNNENNNEYGNIEETNTDQSIRARYVQLTIF